jgi:hypothetical protein
MKVTNEQVRFILEFNNRLSEHEVIAELEYKIWHGSFCSEPKLLVFYKLSGSLKNREFFKFKQRINNDIDFHYSFDSGDYEQCFEYQTDSFEKFKHVSVIVENLLGDKT